jgi:hypothetical protein
MHSVKNIERDNPHLINVKEGEEIALDNVKVSFDYFVSIKTNYLAIKNLILDDWSWNEDIKTLIEILYNKLPERDLVFPENWEGVK